MNFLHRLLSLFDSQERWKLLLITVALFFGSLLEVMGVGLILPFIKIVSDPGFILNNARLLPYLTRWGLDSPRNLTLGACFFLLAVSLFKGTYVMLTMRWSYDFTYRKVLSLQQKVLDGYLTAPYLFHLSQNTARLVKNATYEPEAIGGILKFALFLPAEIVVVTGLAALLAFTQPSASLIGIGALGLIMWAVSNQSRRELSRLGRVRERQHAAMIQWVNQSLGGIKEVMVLGRQRFFSEALRIAGAEYTKALCRSTLLTQYPRVILETSASILVVSFVLIVIVTGQDIRSVVGTLAVFGLAIVRLVPSATRISNALQTMRFQSPSLTAVADALKATEIKARGADSKELLPFERHIEINALSYRYPGLKTNSLENVSLSIKHGFRVAFVGSSGAGKTTLANLILGLLQPTAGQILVDGIDIHKNLRGWQSQLGYIPQDIYLIDDTIRRNVAFGVPDHEIDDHAVRRALESAQLTEFVQTLEKGSGSHVGERGIRISAGQRQRIGIARALYHDPTLLVLDEATSALDNETERLFTAAINALAGRKTVLIIAHRLHTIRNSDRIFMMEAGRIIASGQFDELLTTEPRFAQMVRGDGPAWPPAISSSYHATVAV